VADCHLHQVLQHAYEESKTLHMFEDCRTSWLGLPFNFGKSMFANDTTYLLLSLINKKSGP
jgi:hypothetical protein